MAETTYRVPGLERGLEVLEVLADTPSALSMSEIADKVGKTVGEVFRTLESLQRAGFVAREPNHKLYFLSLKMYELSHRHAPIDRLLRVVRPFMRQIVEATGESCHLSSLTENGEAIVLAQQSSRSRVQLVHQTGSVHRAMHSATGRLLLAHVDREAWDDLQTSDPTFSAMNADQKTELETTFKRIREDGFSYAEDETYVGGRDLAVYLGVEGGTVAAALTVSWILRVARPQRTGDIRRILFESAEQVRAHAGLNVDNSSREADE